MVRLAFFAPDILEASLNGQPLRRLTVIGSFATEPPLFGHDQRQQLGFGVIAYVYRPAA